jgi:hypothetical protein
MLLYIILVTVHDLKDIDERFGQWRILTVSQCSCCNVCSRRICRIGMADNHGFQQALVLHATTTISTQAYFFNCRSLVVVSDFPGWPWAAHCFAGSSSACVVRVSKTSHKRDTARNRPPPLFCATKRLVYFRRARTDTNALPKSSLHGLAVVAMVLFVLVTVDAKLIGNHHAAIDWCACARLLPLAQVDTVGIARALSMDLILVSRQGIIRCCCGLMGGRNHWRFLWWRVFVIVTLYGLR